MSTDKGTPRKAAALHNAPATSKTDTAQDTAPATPVLTDEQARVVAFLEKASKTPRTAVAAFLKIDTGSDTYRVAVGMVDYITAAGRFDGWRPYHVVLEKLGLTFMPRPRESGINRGRMSKDGTVNPDALYRVFVKVIDWRGNTRAQRDEENTARNTDTPPAPATPAPANK
jgi:hypothetical protein